MITEAINFHEISVNQMSFHKKGEKKFYIYFDYYTRVYAHMLSLGFEIFLY